MVTHTGCVRSLWCVPPCSPNRDPIHFEFVSYSSFLSIHFGTEITSTFIHSRSSIENDSRFQTKMGKMYTRFQTKKIKNKKYIYILRGGTYLYGLYKGAPPGTFTVEELQIRMLSSFNGLSFCIRFMLHIYYIQVPLNFVINILSNLA